MKEGSQWMGKLQRPCIQNIVFSLSASLVTHIYCSLHEGEEEAVRQGL